MQWKNEKGYSLLEALVTLVFSGFFMVAVSNFLVSQSKFWISQNLITQTQQTLRTAMKILTADIQEIGLNTLGTSVVSADLASFAFKSDRNGDGIAETITYSLDTTTIGNPKLIRDSQTTTTVNKKPTTTTKTQTVAEHITLLGFRYFDSQGGELGDSLATTDLAKVKLVKVQLGSRLTLPTGTQKEFTLESSSRIRK
ncbi:MAG: hypothetical protein HY731_12725 [Candidatus Tectomicrobia bacterium]|nr:hypothetical protein [Candidatus Tectomicrobia bacterium]